MPKPNSRRQVRGFIDASIAVAMAGVFVSTGALFVAFSDKSERQAVRRELSAQQAQIESLKEQDARDEKSHVDFQAAIAAARTQVGDLKAVVLDSVNGVRGTRASTDAFSTIQARIDAIDQRLKGLEAEER